MNDSFKNLLDTDNLQDAVLLMAVIEAADRIVTEYMADLATLRVSTHVYENPAFLFTDALVEFGETNALEDTDPNALVRELVAIPEWIGLSGAQVAEILLRDEASVFRALLMLVVSLGAIVALGPHSSRSELLAEKINEFASLASDLMHNEV